MISCQLYSFILFFNINFQSPVMIFDRSHLDVCDKMDLIGRASRALYLQVAFVYYEAYLTSGLAPLRSTVVINVLCYCCVPGLFK